MKNITLKFRLNDLIVVFFLILVLVNRSIPIDFSSLWIYSSLLLLYIIGRRIFKHYLFIVEWFIIFYGFIESIYAILQYYNVAESNHSLFTITGSFSNPGQLAGLLAISLIICIGKAIESVACKKYSISFIVFQLTLLTAYALILTNSRAGIISAFAGALFILTVTNNNFKSLIKSRALKAVTLRVVFFFCIIYVLAIIYLYKKDSANGRLFIWNNTKDMIMDRPIMGFGSGGWQSHYMHYQANYFKNNPNSKFIMLADNIGYPYNELLHLIANHGILGILIFMCLFYSIFSHKFIDKSNNIFQAAFIGILIYSCFSYPSFIYRLCILVVIVMTCLKSRKILLLRTTFYFHFLIYSCIIIILSFVTIWSYKMELDVKRNIYKAFEQPNTNECFFTKKYDLFCYNPQLIDLYAQYSYKFNSLDKAEKVLLLAKKISPSCELYCDLGDIYAQKGETFKAIEYYKTASNMIPSRIIPHYKLFVLFKMNGDTISACETGKHLLTQPIKVENTKIIRLKSIVKNYLSKYQITN